ncbi:alpha/beta fold hydrolase [Cryptosporangium minutisporangium]|uniref:Alpha/beta fold hydrolase n=1 Tax=Cryptosporangium minutisporangium TaxID=113569 RepID=A0ABP6T6B5_9ACTN
MELQYRDVHGYRRAFRRSGSGPTILLIHGVGDSSATWSHVLPQLAEHYDVIAPDLLGHGGSDKPRADYAVAAYACGMRDLLSVLDVERVTVIGHSLGGGVAMQFAYQFPDRCERLVLVGSGGIGPEVHPLLRLATAPGAEHVLRLVGTPPVRAISRISAPVLRRLGRLAAGRDVDYIADTYPALDDGTAREAFLRTLRAAVDPRGQVITMLDRCYLTEGLPTLLIWGAEDGVIPVQHAELAHEAMPGSRLEIFEGAGHFPHRTDPDRFLRVVEEFVKGTDPPEYDAKRWRTLLREGRPGPFEVSSGS